MKFINGLPNLLFQIEQLQVINFNMVQYPNFHNYFIAPFIRCIYMFIQIL